MTTEECLGSFTQGEWRALSVGEGQDEVVQKQVSEVRADLQGHLSSILNAEHLVVLTGLGTSLEIENSHDGTKRAPSMGDLWREISQLQSFENAQAHLDPELLREGNLEHILSDAQARASVLGLDVIRTFVEEAEKAVLKACSFVDSGSRLDTHELFLRKVARRASRLQRAQVFTTNYDLAFEYAARRTRFKVVDGFGTEGMPFDGSSFDLDFVQRRPNEPLALDPKVFQLLKLHGSVDWERDGYDVIRRPITAAPLQPVLIYPSASKYQLSFQQPFLEIMARFHAALRQTDVGMIVVGSGLKDEHLVAPIEAALRSNIGVRAVFVTPAARDDSSKSATLEWVGDLIRQGDRRLAVINGTFADLVRLLPDVPAKDERDAYLDRIQSPRSAGN